LIKDHTMNDQERFGLQSLLGRCLARSNRPAEAIQAFDRAMRYNPTSLVALVERGRAYMQLHEPDRARDDFTAAIEHWPHSPEAYLERAAVFEADGQKALADQDRNRARELDPNQRTDASRLPVATIEPDCTPAQECDDVAEIIR
jgi:tetratricopeptide (TPR) repeat protein